MGTTAHKERLRRSFGCSIIATILTGLAGAVR
jgi:hypothetical protein